MIKRFVPLFVLLFSFFIVRAVGDPAILGIEVLGPTGMSEVLSNSVTLVDSTTFDPHGDYVFYLSTTYPNGTIYYTLDGSEPSALGKRYGAGFPITNSVQLRAITYSSDFSQSANRDLNVNFVPALRLGLVGYLKKMYVTDPGGSEAPVVPSTANPTPNYFVLLVASNSIVRIRAASDDQWQFQQWRGFTNSTAETINLLVDHSADLEMDHITTNVVPSTALGQGDIAVDRPPPYAWSDVLQITAVPTKGSFFAGWVDNTVYGPTIDTVSPTYAVPVIDLFENSRTVQFAPLPAGYHSLTIMGEGGPVSVLGTNKWAFANGETVVIRAFPERGASFSNWTGAASNIDYSAQITMDSDKQLTAHVTPHENWVSYVSAPDPATWSLPAIGDDGVAYVTGVAGLYAIAPGGLVKWFHTLYSAPFSNAVIGPDGTVYAASSSGVWAVSSTGVLKWRVASAGGFEIALSLDGLYVSGFDGMIRRYSFDGNLLNQVQLAEPFGHIIAIDSDGNVIAAGNALYKFSSTLQPVWQQNTGTLFGVAPISIARDNSIYAIGGHFSADGQDLSPATFQPYPVPVMIGTNQLYPGSAAPIASDLSIFVSSIYAFDVNHTYTSVSRLLGGVSIWDAHYGGVGSIHFTAGNLAPNGILYFSSTEVHAVNAGIGPASSPWPMAYADWRNTSQIEPAPLPPNTLRATLSAFGVHLEFQPEVADPLTLEFSDDLKTWNPVVTFSGMLLDDVDPNATSSRFFRVRR